jgi:rubrerythrin
MERDSNEHQSSRDQLRSKKTVYEILEVAIRFEETAYSFYSELIFNVSKKIRYLVEELAAEEKEHVKLFSELMENPDIEQTLSEMITVPASNNRFSDAIHTTYLGENPDDQAILQYALAREQAAMEQYTALSKEIESGPIHDLFLYLSQQETEHKNELEKLYYETIHSGGV